MVKWKLDRQVITITFITAFGETLGGGIGGYLSGGKIFTIGIGAGIGGVAAYVLSVYLYSIAPSLKPRVFLSHLEFFIRTILASLIFVICIGFPIGNLFIFENEEVGTSVLIFFLFEWGRHGGAVAFILLLSKSGDLKKLKRVSNNPRSESDEIDSIIVKFFLVAYYVPYILSMPPSLAVYKSLLDGSYFNNESDIYSGILIIVYIFSSTIGITIAALFLIEEDPEKSKK